MPSAKPRKTIFDSNEFTGPDHWTKPVMQNPTPAPIIVPAVGAPTCRGIALAVRDLSEWRREGDHYEGHPDRRVLAYANRATWDNHVLCLRPTADRPACVGLTATAFAVASLQEDFAARALVVDPYDAEGNDIREAPQTLTPYESAQVATWEASEAT